LIECDYCYNQVYTLEPFTNAFRQHREATQRGEVDQDVAVVQETIGETAVLPLWLRKPALAAAAVLVGISAVVSILYLTESRSGSISTPPLDQTARPTGVEDARSPWRNVKIPQAACMPPAKWKFRDATAAGFNQAMKNYQEGRFGEAADQLLALDQLDGRGVSEIQFYLGVSLLLADRYEEAIGSLTRAAELSVGQRQQDSHYYLALAYLKTNRPRQAMDELSIVAAQKGDHQAEAKKLKQQLRGDR
jgi:hypothetical protein